MTAIDEGLHRVKQINFRIEKSNKSWYRQQNKILRQYVQELKEEMQDPVIIEADYER